MFETTNTLLDVSGVGKIFTGKKMGKRFNLKALDSIYLSVSEGEILGLVGESGCGKSTLAKVITHLDVPTYGEVLFRAKSVSSLKGTHLLEYRKAVQMIFQDPYASMNPRKKIRHAVIAPLKSLTTATRSEVQAKFEAVMRSVGISENLWDRYPYELSGGQLQRVAIARAIIVNPSLLVADEPIAALDVSIQSQILNLLSELRRSMGLTIIFISHDLNVVSKFTDRIGVMYLGNLVEIGSTADVFSSPLHPYTRALIRSIPRLDVNSHTPLEVLEGEVPSLYHVPSGCPFHPRCPLKTERCLNEKPSLLEYKSAQKRYVACHNPI